MEANSKLFAVGKYAPKEKDVDYKKIIKYDLL